MAQDPAPKEGTHAAIHIELGNALVKSINQKAGKVTYIIEVEPQNRLTTMEEESSILEEGYKSQIVIEAAYEEPVEEDVKNGKVSKGQQKLQDWTNPAGDSEAADA